VGLGCGEVGELVEVVADPAEEIGYLVCFFVVGVGIVVVGVVVVVAGETGG